MRPDPDELGRECQPKSQIFNPFQVESVSFIDKCDTPGRDQLLMTFPPLNL